MKSARHVVSLVALLIACWPAATPADDAPIVIKFSHVAAPDTPKGRAAERFKAVAERRSNGKLRIEIYPNSTLYKDKDEIDALLNGQVQMLAPSIVRLQELGVQEFEVFNAPYIFPGK